MKKAQKVITSILLAVTVLLAVPFQVSAAEAHTLEQIYATGDYNVGSVYGPRLNKAELDQVAAAVLTFVESYDWTGLDDYTKVSYAHQYLCNICDYAPDWSKNRANSAWGALVYGEAQCSGYARAFKALCDAIGIGCYYVHADDKASNPDHQWNEVCVDGVWYIIDVQCNDSSGFPAVYLVSGSTYANCSGMSWNHDGLPECTKDYFSGDAEYGQDSQKGSQTTSLPSQEGSGTARCIEEYEGNNKCKTTFYNSDGTIDFYVISEYEYKEGWKRDKSTFYHADGTVNFCTLSEYAYDENGNEVESVCYYADGTFQFHKTCEYDGNGNKIKSTSYNEDGTPALYVFYKYDEKGRSTVDTFCDSSGAVEYYMVYEYDANGKVGITFWNADWTLSMPLIFW